MSVNAVWVNINGCRRRGKIWATSLWNDFFTLYPRGSVQRLTLPTTAHFLLSHARSEIEVQSAINQNVRWCSLRGFDAVSEALRLTAPAIILTKNCMTKSTYLYKQSQKLNNVPSCQMHTDKHWDATITSQRNIWCWHLTVSDSSALPSQLEEEKPHGVFEEILPSYLKMHRWPSRKWSWQHVRIYCSPSSMQNHMSLNHSRADELPLQIYEMENTKVVMKTKSTFTK